MVIAFVHRGQSQLLEAEKIGYHLYQTGWSILSSHKSPFFLNKYGLHNITLDITSITRKLHSYFHIPVQQYGRRNSLSWIRNCSVGRMSSAINTISSVVVGQRWLLVVSMRRSPLPVG